MAGQYRELCQVWSLRLSITTAIIVLLLSWLNEIRLSDLIIRAGISFGVMYVLMIGSLNLFEKAAHPNTEEAQSADESGRGQMIDFSVGDGEPGESGDSTEGQADGFPGQVNRDLKAGLPDSEKQAEIVKRMGWN